MARTETLAHKNKNRIVFVLFLTTIYLVVEIVGSLLTHSLALLADATHRFVDLAMVIMTLIAIRISSRRANTNQTYGYLRAEVLVAFINALVLLIAAAYIFYQAYLRLISPPAYILAAPVSVIAFVGLIVNLMGMKIMSSSASKSINVKSLYLEAWMDSLSSVGAMTAGIIILFTGAYVVDAIFGVFIGILIVPRVFELLGESAYILMEGTPKNIDVKKLERELKRIKGVRYIHHLHVWCLTSGICSASVHLGVHRGYNNQKMLNRITDLFKKEFDIEHVTVQFESGKMMKEFEH